MNEFTIEQKAQAYDEAIKRGLDYVKQTPVTEMVSRKDIFEAIFPELKESDERIRKELIQLISYMHDADHRKKDWLAWFEKQESVGEIVERCKTSWYNEGKIQGQIEGLSDDEKYQQGLHDALEKQGEQKTSYPNWISVEDELPPKLKNKQYTDYYIVYSTRGVQKMRYNYDRMDWQDESGMMYIAKWGVTHWMRMPEPPKEGGEE